MIEHEFILYSWSLDFVGCTMAINILRYSPQIYSGVFTYLSLKRVIHPSFTLFAFTLQKGDSPSRVNTFTFLEGWVFFREAHSSFGKDYSPFKKGDWKGE